MSSKNRRRKKQPATTSTPFTTPVRPENLLYSLTLYCDTEALAPVFTFHVGNNPENQECLQGHLQLEATALVHPFGGLKRHLELVDHISLQKYFFDRDLPRVWPYVKDQCQQQIEDAISNFTAAYMRYSVWKYVTYRIHSVRFPELNGLFRGEVIPLITRLDLPPTLATPTSAGRIRLR